MPTLTSFDTRQLRNVLGTFPTGVTIVTTRDAQGLGHGVTANSFSSISLDPPLVLWSQALTSKSLAAFQQSKHFAVNILADDQIALSNHFAKSNDDKFATVAHTSGLGGAPLLPGTSAHFECVKVAEYPGGDHVVYFGRVERVGYSGRRPLTFAHGKYMVSYAHELGPVALARASAVAVDEESVRLATSALPALRTQTGATAVGLAVWGNHGPTIIQWASNGSVADLQLQPGHVLSVTNNAVGQAFAAWLPAAIVKPFLEEDLRLLRIADEDERTQQQRFEALVERARQAGVARGVADLTDSMSTVCVPIMNNAGLMVMGLVLLTNDAQDDAAMADILTAAAAALRR